MRAEFVKKCSDYKGPVVDIFASEVSDAFLLGILFEKITACGGCVWKNGNSIRLPLVAMDDIGLAKLFEDQP